MKGMKRGSRRPSGSEKSGMPENAGFVAKNSSMNAVIGERRIRLNTKPIASSASAKPKAGAPVKMPNLSLRASLNRMKTSEHSEVNDLTKNLMDDQSIASFGITESSKYGIHPDVAQALAINNATTGNLNKSTSAISMPDPETQDTKRKSKVSLEQLNASWSESNNEGILMMFDDFTQERRSSVAFLGESDPFNTPMGIPPTDDDDDDDDDDVEEECDDKPPAVQRASHVEDEEEDTLQDESNPSEQGGKSTTARDPMKPKKSKMQKIGELLLERKQLALQRRALQAKVTSQAEQIARLEKEAKEFGDLGTRTDIMKALNEHNEEVNKLTKELDKARKEAKLAKNQLVAKKDEMLSKDKELEANMTEISSLRKELSQALQQVDMLEEELDNDKTKILTLTKGLLGQSSDDLSFDDIETRQEQQEIFERELKEKDRKIESQRIELTNQAEQIRQLKAEVESSQKLSRKNEALVIKITQLTESNEDVNNELEMREEELATMRRNFATLNAELGAKCHQIAKDREQTASASYFSRAIGQGDKSVETLQQDLRSTKDALSDSQKCIESINSQNRESIEHLIQTIKHLEQRNSELQSQLHQGDLSSHAKIEKLELANQHFEQTILKLEQTIEADRKESSKLESKLNLQISSLRASLEASQTLLQQSENETKLGVNKTQAKLSETEMALEEMKLYNEELEASVFELRETSADFEQELLRIQDEHIQLQAKARKQADDLSLANNAIQEMQDQSRALELKNQGLEAKMVEVVDENQRMKGQLASVENVAADDRHAMTALEDLMDEYDELQEEANSLRDRVTFLEQELERFKAKNEELKAFASCSEKKLEETQELLNLANSAGSELELLRNESKDARHSLATTQRELDEIVVERDELCRKCDKSDLELIKLRAECERLRSVQNDAEGLMSHVDQLTKERDSWIKSASEASINLSARQNEINELKSMRIECTRLRAEADELRGMVDALRLQIETQKQEREAFRIAAEKAEAELVKSQDMLVSLEDLMEDFELLQTEADTLLKEKLEIETRHDQLKKEKNDVDEATREIKSKLDAAIFEVDSLRDQLNSRDEDTKLLVQKNADLVSKITDLNTILDDSTMKSSYAHDKAKEVEDLSNKCSELQDRVNVIELRSDGLRRANDELELKVRNLESEKYKLESACARANERLDEERRFANKNPRYLREVDLDPLHSQRNEATANGASRSRALPGPVASVSAAPIVDDELRLEVVALRAENNKLTVSIAELNKERNQLVEKNMEVQMQLAERESALATVDVASRDRMSVQGELDVLRKNYDSLKQMVDRLTSDRDHWRQVAETSEHHAGEANDALISLEEQMEQQRRADREQMNAEARTLQSQIDELVAERATLKRALEESENGAALQIAEMTTLRLSLAELDELKRKFYLLQSENAELGAKIASSTKERDSLQASAVLAESRSREVHLELVALKTKHDDLLSMKLDAEKLREENLQANSQIAELHQRLAGLDTAVCRAEDAERDLDRSKRLIIVYEERIEHLDAQLAELNVQVRDLVEERMSLLSASDGTKEELANARASLAAYETLESEHQMLKLENSRRIADYDAEIRLLTDANSKLIADSETETRMLEDMHTRLITDSKAEMQSLKDAYAKLARDSEAEQQLLKDAYDQYFAKSEAEIRILKEGHAQRLRDVECEIRMLKDAHATRIFELEAEIRMQKDANTKLFSDSEAETQLLVKAHCERLAALEAEIQSYKDVNAKLVADSEADVRVLKEGNAELFRESQDQIRILKDVYSQRLADLETEIGMLKDTNTKLITDSEVTVRILKDAQAQNQDLDTELQTLKDAYAKLLNDAEGTKSQKHFLEKELATVSHERDELRETVQRVSQNTEELSRKLLALEKSKMDLANLMKEVDIIRGCLTLSSTDDLIEAVKNLQQDYNDVLDENDRLRDALADLEGELAEINAERDELILQAEERVAGASSLVSRSTNDATGMQELCEELQRQLQAMTRDRDLWKETADTVAGKISKGEKKKIRSDHDDYSISSSRSIGTEQRILLQQALEYRERRDGRKNSWGFSTFGVPRSTKVESESSPDSSVREELIDKLSELNQTYQQTIEQLKSEIVGLNTSLKEETYSMKKKLDALDHENQAYELKVMALEHELERVGTEAKRHGGEMDQNRLSSLENELKKIMAAKDNADRHISKLEATIDKLNRASSLDLHHKQVEIDNLKSIQADIQAKAEALENMMNAVNQENETLRRIAEKAANFSIASDLALKLGQDVKDVIISRLQHELAELRLQGHKKLHDQIVQLQSEKQDMQRALEDHYRIMDEENRTHLEDLEMRLKAREQTIKQLERVLETVGVISDDVSTGEVSYDASDGNTTYISDQACS